MSLEGTTEGRSDAERNETPLLEVEGLKKHFSQADGFLDRVFGETGSVRAVDGVDLDIRRGETLAIVGESGCGKSTLGLSLMNLHTPTAGSVRFKGEDITGLPEKRMRRYRRDIQMIFQDPLASLNPRQTVGQILTAPMEVHGIGESKADRLERARDLLERVGLNPRQIDRYPHQFSGGQQQRVGIARALAVEPDLLVADEPVSALDVSVQAQILRLLGGLQEELGISMLFIAHDLSVIRHIADRVAVMYLGRIVETAPAANLFEDPRHPYTRSLLSAVPRIDPEAREERVILEGTVPSPLDPPSGCRFHTRCPVVIPPEGWEADQPSFVRAFTYRNRVLDGNVDVDAVRTRLEAEEGSTPDPEAVRDQLVEGLLPGGLDTLPSTAVEAIRESAAALVDDDAERARSIVEDAFRSPCEGTVRRTHVEPDHSVDCHRVDPEMSAEEFWPV